MFWSRFSLNRSILFANHFSYNSCVSCSFACVLRTSRRGGAPSTQKGFFVSSLASNSRRRISENLPSTHDFLKSFIRRRRFSPFFPNTPFFFPPFFGELMTLFGEQQQEDHHRLRSSAIKKEVFPKKSFWEHTKDFRKLIRLFFFLFVHFPKSSSFSRF